LVRVALRKVFGSQDGGFFVFTFSGVGAQQMIGIVPAFVLFMFFLFTAFGGKKKYWWVGILLLPVVWFVWKFDLAHWYFYVGLALAGWIVGWIIGKLISSFRRK